MAAWAEAPSGSGPTGLGETPMLSGSTWWVRRGGITYGFGAGFGDLATAQQAAGNLMTWFATNAPSRQSVPEVSAFQSAYNGSGLPGSLTVDGQYGPNTQAALQAVLNQVTGPPQAAPQNVFSSSIPATPAADQPVAPVPSATSTSTPTPSASAPSTSIPTPVIIGGAALAGAGLIYWAWRRKKRR